jgi:hypothetical protein
MLLKHGLDAFKAWIENYEDLIKIFFIVKEIKQRK